MLAAGADLNAPNDDGETPLMRAVMMGDAELVEALVKAGANVNAADKSGKTALDYGYAEEPGIFRDEITKFLKKAGARARQN
jgi:ankyrin repeat protein